MKIYGGMEVEIRFFFTLAIFGGEWLASGPSHFTLREPLPQYYTF
jgi:hypothetical protein